MLHAAAHGFILWFHSFLQPSMQPFQTLVFFFFRLLAVMQLHHFFFSKSKMCCRSRKLLLPLWLLLFTCFFKRMKIWLLHKNARYVRNEISLRERKKPSRYVSEVNKASKAGSRDGNSHSYTRTLILLNDSCSNSTDCLNVI